jgi:hypothetical protein
MMMSRAELQADLMILICDFLIIPFTLISTPDPPLTDPHPHLHLSPGPARRFDEEMLVVVGQSG